MSDQDNKSSYAGGGDRPSGGGDRKGPRSFDKRNDRGGRPGGPKKPYHKDGERKPYDRDRKPYDGERKPYDRDRKSFDKDRKPYDKDRRDGDRKPYDKDRKPYDRDRRDGDRKPFDGDRKYGRQDRGERKPFDSDRKPYDRDRKPYDGERKPYDKDRRDGDRKPYDRDRKPYDKDRKPYDGERKPFDKDRKPFDRDRRDGDRKSFDGERKFRDGDRKPFDGERKSYDRDRKPFDGERKPFDRDRRDGDRKPFDRERRDFDGKPREDRPAEAGERSFAAGDKPFKREYKYEANPKDQARKGYQNRKPRHEGGAASPARLAALKVVSDLRIRDAFAQDLISKHIDRSQMSPEDRAFATKLVLGVVSTRGTLDDILNRCMNHPDDVSASVRDALQISAYEIIFLEKGAHAAVDQGVELVRSVAPKAAGVGNAILRKLASIKDEFPFGDPQRDVRALSRQHAFPVWLTEELLGIMSLEEVQSFMTICNEPAPVYIGLNAAKEGEGEVLETLTAARGNPVAAEIDGKAIPGCYLLETGQVLTDGRIKRLLNNGHLLVSDIASQAVAGLVLPEEKPQSLLEIGAGRATKTVLIQSNAVRKWGSQIEEYVALDNIEFKTKLLTERVEAYGINVTEAVTGDATNLAESIGDKQFDVVFIDAPCTGVGTLRRHPEIRWRLKPETIDENAELGLSMLKEAAGHVNPGGTLVYATCTVTRKENISVIKSFLESEEGADFTLTPIDGKAAFASTLTSGGSDAHFAAKMVKKA